MIITTPAGNRIEIRNNNLTGKETVLFNNIIVSEKMSIGGKTHLFTVKENNEEVNYEVEMNTKWHGMGHYVNVRRRGELIFTNK